MIKFYVCPNCGSAETKTVYRSNDGDILEQTRVCETCNSQYTNKYDLIEQDLEIKEP